MNEKLSGVVVPTITPFKENGGIAVELLGPYLDFLASKVHGLSIGAIYGSGILMQIEQRKQLAKIVQETVGGKVPLSFFVGSPDTDRAVLLARYAEKIGYQAVSSVQPIYYRQVDEAIFRHYKAIIEAVDIPVYVYDSPIYAGNPISLPILGRLEEIGLAGIITGAATLGIEHVWSVLRSIEMPGFDVWSIRDGLALPAMMMGAVGFESGVGNFFPELVLDLYQAIKEKDYEKAKLMQTRTLKLREISHSLGKNIPTLHTLISMRGFKTGSPKRPFFLLNDEEIASLKKKMSKIDFPVPLSIGLEV